VVYVSEELFQQQIRSKVEPGDIVMAKIGAKCGTCAILPENHSVGIIAGNCLKISTNPEVCNNYFLLNVLHYLYTKTGLVDIKTETAQPAISLKNLKTLKFLLPPLNEQHRIAAVLQACDEEIELLEQKLVALKRQKQGLMQKLLTGQVRVKAEG